VALSNAAPKPPARWIDKAKRKAAEAKAIKECYAQVDQRDGRQCRVCQARVGGVGLLGAAHHHHLVYRSKGGQHEPSNTLLLCVKCHHALHNGEIALSGDANARQAESGRLCGVKLERYTDAGWRVERWL
jgi:5-methylcytosine-specific restriction endonuclease McrA